MIANQENLLNTYRCLFGVDTNVVPGGCDDPDMIVPGATPQNPTQQDLDVRDGLIESQEALLNVYRCRFNVDTQLVPGSCIEGRPAPPVPAVRPVITAGREHSCAILHDRSIVCWGDNEFGKVEVPSGEYTEVSAGWSTPAP